jgi:hypothetical protein
MKHSVGGSTAGQLASSALTDRLNLPGETFADQAGLERAVHEGQRGDEVMFTRVA